MCNSLHAPSLAAPPELSHAPNPLSITPADMLAVEVHTRADRRRIQRSARATMAAMLLANHALDRISRLISSSRLDPWSRSLIAEEMRAVACAQQAALLQAAETDGRAGRLGRP